MSLWKVQACSGAPSSTCWRKGAPSCWSMRSHIKAVPGRKTDVKDSEWLADLLRHGLLRPSFIPPPAIRVLRDLTRYRKNLVEHRTQEINRVHKVWETPRDAQRVRSNRAIKRASGVYIDVYQYRGDCSVEHHRGAIKKWASVPL